MKATSIPRILAPPNAGIALNNRDKVSTRPPVNITNAMIFREFSSMGAV